jgi:peroxidase
MASTRAAAIVLLVALICGAMHHNPAAAMKVDTTGMTVANGLSFDFYRNSCPFVEHIVEFFVGEAFRKDAGIAPALIRIFFHDCFPQGCDASVLLNGTASEQKEIPNQTLRPTALKLIEDIRAAVHSACGGPVVSCADIISLATRDALVDAGGPSFDVPLGRRDGLAPAKPNITNTLPAPFFDVPRLIKSFGDRGLDVTDLVALSGAHSFGVAHCPAFNDRFTPGPDTNPAIDPKFAATLKAKCAGDNPVGTVTQKLDVRTPDVFDNKYYFDLIAKQGLFKSDQGLVVHPATNRTAIRFSLNQAAFFDQFAKSMFKMSQMDVLTGTQGEIRNNCAVPNKRVGIVETVAGDVDEGVAAEM